MILIMLMATKVNMIMETKVNIIDSNRGALPYPKRLVMLVVYLAYGN